MALRISHGSVRWPQATSLGSFDTSLGVKHLLEYRHGKIFCNTTYPCFRHTDPQGYGLDIVERHFNPSQLLTTWLVMLLRCAASSLEALAHCVHLEAWTP